MKRSGNTIIESLGVYLPAESFSTAEVLEGCKNKVRFPLEKISGIKTRRMAGKDEFSYDLAKNAVADCLKNSKYDHTDIELLICCNISRMDSPDLVTFEPSTSVRLRKHFGFPNALVFDITNACAGTFTGIYLLNSFLKSGAIRRGMVVSGEYITHLTQTAQNEINKFMDPRMACLTLGDAGTAMILENSVDSQTGFQEIDLQTFGRYSPYCVAKASEQGGWIMHTDSVNLADVAIKSGAEHSMSMLDGAGWSPNKFQHLIMHQTSKMTLDSARREINSLLKGEIFHDGNTINNLENRGNTASTSHFVAISDHIRSKNINSGDKVVFSISASGLTVGTALYVFDDLPDRIREITPTQSSESSYNGHNTDQLGPRIRIESVGTIPEMGPERKDSLEILQAAATNCLESSSYTCEDIGLLIYSGVYRSEYLMEPALAAVLAGKLDMNATITEPDSKKTLAFDLFNGSIGFLNACYTAQQVIASGDRKTAMIVASECENNIGLVPEQLIGVREAASAIILDAHPLQEQERGFSRFLFDYNLDSIDAFTSNCSTSEIEPRLYFEKAPNLEELYITSIVPVVQELLKQEGLDFDQIDLVFPPQISTGFIAQLSKQLNFPSERFVKAVGDGPDLSSSSLPYGIKEAYEKGLVKAGDTGLLISVGSGYRLVVLFITFEHTG